MGCKCGILDRCVDEQSAAFDFADGTVQAADVDQSACLFDILAQEVDQIGPATQKSTIGADTRKGVRPVRRSDVGQGGHAAVSASIASMASTIPLCAPQRQRLPLMRSRISARVATGGPAARSWVT